MQDTSGLFNQLRIPQADICASAQLDLVAKISASPAAAKVRGWTEKGPVYSTRYSDGSKNTNLTLYSLKMFQTCSTQEAAKILREYCKGLPRSGVIATGNGMLSIRSGSLPRAGNAGIALDTILELNPKFVPPRYFPSLAHQSKVLSDLTEEQQSYLAYHPSDIQGDKTESDSAIPDSQPSPSQNPTSPEIFAMGSDWISMPATPNPTLPQSSVIVTSK